MISYKIPKNLCLSPKTRYQEKNQMIKEGNKTVIIKNKNKNKKN